MTNPEGIGRTDDQKAQEPPERMPVYELDDPYAPYGLAAMGGGYVIVRPPAAGSVGEVHP